MKLRLPSGRKQTIFFFTNYFVRTGNPRYLGTKQKNKLSTKVTKYVSWKLSSSETEIDAQACNVLYLFKRFPTENLSFVLTNLFPGRFEIFQRYDPKAYNKNISYEIGQGAQYVLVLLTWVVDMNSRIRLGWKKCSSWPW